MLAIPAHADLQDGLVSYWPLDEVAGSKTPDLMSGYDLGLRNLTAADLVPGKVGKAFHFDNVRETMLTRIHIAGELLPINQHPAFTVAFWIKVAGAGSIDLRMFSEASTTNSDPLFSLGTPRNGDSGRVDFYLRQSPWLTVNHLQTQREPLDGTWHHLAFVQQEGGSRALFIDGAQDPAALPAKEAGDWRLNTTSIGGILRTNPTHWVTGTIDEVALWSRALTAPEITQVVSEGLSSAFPLSRGMVAYWPLDEVAGSKTPDLMSGYDLELRSLTAADLVPGKVGKAFHFDNTRETMLTRIHIPGEQLPIHQHPAFTATFWIKVAGAGLNDLRIFSEASTANSYPLFSLGTPRNGDPGPLDFYLRQTRWEMVDHLQTQREPLDGAWHHLAFVQQEGGARAFFIDGVRDPVALPAKEGGDWRLDTTSIGGILRASPSHWMTGTIDDVALWNRALTEPEITQAVSEGLNGAFALRRGMVAYWPLDEVAETRTPDLMSRYDLELHNLTAADLVAGKVGKAFHFDSTRQTMLTRIHSPGEQLPINQHPAFTVAFWIKAAGAGLADLRMVSEASTTDSYPLFSLGTPLGGDSGRVNFYLRQSPWELAGHLLTQREPLDGTWHHLAYVQQRGGLRALFIDGEQDPVALPPQGAADWRLDTTSIGGILRANATHWITGEIDDVALWSRTLSAAEIGAVMTNGTPVPPGKPHPLAIRFFKADSPAVAAGDSVTLRWDVTRNVEVEIDQGIGSVTEKTISGLGSAEVAIPLTRTFTLTLRRGAESVSASATVAAIDGIDPGWMLIDNFDRYPVGLLAGNGGWYDLDAVDFSVVEHQGNRCLAPNAGDAAAMLPLRVLAVAEGQERTLFFRVYLAGNSEPVRGQVALTDRRQSSGTEVGTNVGPGAVISDERGIRLVGGYHGHQNTLDFGQLEPVLEPDTPYNVWVDIKNGPFTKDASANPPVEIDTGDTYSIHVAKDGASHRTTVISNYPASRDPVGLADRGFTQPVLDKLVIGALAGHSGTTNLFLDDIYLSKSGYNSTVPRALGFTEPVTFGIRSPVRSGEILQGDALRFNCGPILEIVPDLVWDFGDGRSATLVEPGTIAFPNRGMFQVTLAAREVPGGRYLMVDSRAIDVMAATNAIPDLAVTAPSVPSGLAVGQPAPVTYTVRNAGDSDLSGRTWKDAIYLSRDAFLDANDRLLLSAQVSNNVAIGGTYTGTLAVTIPTVEEGAWHLVFSVDDEWQILEHRQLNNEFAVATDLFIPRLTNAAPFSSSFSAAGDEKYYRIDVTAGQNLLIRLDDADNQGANEIYVRFGALPTRGTFDLRAAILASADQQLLIPAAAAGTYYVMVRGESVTGDGIYTLQATAASMSLTSITPEHHGNTADAILTLRGAGFGPDTIATLVSSGGTAYSNNVVAVDSFTQITVTIPSNSVPVGRYTVRVQHPDWGMAELAGAFEMTAGGTPMLSTSLIVPKTVGYHGLATHYIEYQNSGNAAMPAPLLVLRGLQNGTEGAWLTLKPTRLAKGFWTSAQPEGFSHSVQVLASGATPGVLQPGETFRVPVYYAGWQQPWDFSYPPIEWQLGVLQADDATPVNWAEFKGSMKPASMNSEAWDNLWSNFIAQAGPTWGSYVAMLDHNAAYLGQLGQRVLDLGDLLAFEFLQADGLNPMRTLAGAADATVEAPGLPITFSRALAQSISRRYELGPLGRGWSHNWQYSLTQASDGTVTITGPGGSRRSFQPDSRNANYFAQAGDHGMLQSLGGGRFSLQEANGLLSAFRADGNLDYVQDLNGNRITAGYGGASLISLTHSSGRSLNIAYNGAGYIQSVTDPVGRQTVYSYAGEHLTSVRQADGSTTMYAYADGHKLLNISGSCCSERAFTYDPQGRLAAAWSGQTEEAVTFSYDNAGGVTVRDALNNASRFFFDHRGLMVKTDNALGHAVHLDFDENYSLARVTDPAGRSYRYDYDSRGNMISSTDPLGAITRFAFDGRWNRLSAITDAKGNGTRYNYTPQGNLQSITYADGSLERWAYDAMGLPTCWTNRRGQAITYDFGTNAQLRTKNYPRGTNAVFEYDPRGNLITASNETGRLVFAYDSTDRLTRIDYPFGPWLQFTYNEAGKRASSLDQLGHRLNYFYDTAGRLQSMTDEHTNRVVLYTYDPAGRLARKEVGNGMYTTYAYDAAGQVLHLVNTLSNGTIISRFDYTYDSRARRTSMDTLDGKWDYGYDDLGQLIRAVFASRNGDIPHQNLTYIYDALGNRVRTIENGVTTEYTANNMNQYTRTVASNGQTTEYTFDADGNLISETATHNGESATTNLYDYNVENRLIEMISSKGINYHVYDAHGNRVATSANGDIKKWVADPFMLTSVVAEYDASGRLLAHYNYGKTLLSHSGINTDRYDYAFDGIGNVIQMVAANGTIAGFYSYAPFGSLLSHSGVIWNPFGFAGQDGVISDANAILFMRFRSYDPTTGRFMTCDPLGIRGKDVNPYRYAENSPLVNVDPMGFFSWHQFTQCMAEDFYKGMLWDQAIENSGIWNIAGVYISKTLLGRLVLLYSLYDLGNSVSDCGDMPDSISFAGMWGYGPYLRALIVGGEIPIYTGGFTGAGVTIITGSSDPNQKTGPFGFGTNGFIVGDRTLAYRIDFENDTNASAPAQQVVLTDQLHANIDWSAFRLTEVGFGDQLIVAPPGSLHFETNVAMSYMGTNFEVKIEAGINLVNGQVSAVFRSMDPGTGLPPPVNVGFLPPEDGTGRGQGHIGYTVKSKPNVPTGAQIRNVALISFDLQPSIATNQKDPHNPAAGTDSAKECLNTIDAGAPTSQVLPLPATNPSAQFAVSWSGTDDAGGSGVGSYDIYVATDGGPWTLWLRQATNTSAVFAGEPSRRYAFCSLATDYVGNQESRALTADAVTEVSAMPLLDVSWLLTPATPSPGQPFTCTITVTNRGSMPARSVLFTNELPAGVTVLWVGFGRGNCGIEDGLIWWRIGDLNAQSAAQLVVTMVSPTEDFYADRIFACDSEGRTSASQMPVWRVGNPPLLLDVALMNGEVELSWPLTPETYLLESTAALDAGASWTMVPGRLSTSGFRNAVILPLSAEGQFYRLKRQ